MEGVPSSSLSVEGLQEAEVVSAQLRISCASRPAESLGDGFQALVIQSGESREFSAEFSSRFCTHISSRCRFFTIVLTQDSQSSKARAISTVSSARRR